MAKSILRHKSQFHVIFFFLLKFIFDLLPSRVALLLHHFQVRVQFAKSPAFIVFEEHDDVDNSLIHDDNDFIREREQLHLQRNGCSADRYWRRYYLPKRQASIQIVEVIVDDFMKDLFKQLPDYRTDCASDLTESDTEDEEDEKEFW